MCNISYIPPPICKQYVYFNVLPVYVLYISRISLYILNGDEN